MWSRHNLREKQQEIRDILGVVAKQELSEVKVPHMSKPVFEVYQNV